MEIIKFTPLLKQTIWGGEKIKDFKQLDTDLEQIGESWEISGVEGNETIISSGEYKGMNLNYLLSIMKEKLIGIDNYNRFGNEFPLLIKFIDARKQLSIQVHPDDRYAKVHGLKRGKTEMWYIMESDENATLYSGLKKVITPEQYREMVEDGTITSALKEYNVKEGDVFYLPAGRIHSIGPGCFLAEIQQTSDTTYRIYDFKRKDKDGNYRQLHTQQAAECIDYHIEKDYRTKKKKKKNEKMTVINSAYFTTSIYDITKTMVLDYSLLDSFIILIGLSGEAKLRNEKTGKEINFIAGESILLPATIEYVRVDGKIKFIETYI